MALQVVLVLAGALLVWGMALVHPPAMRQGDHPAVLWGLACRCFGALPRLAVVLSLLLVLAEGVMLNLMLSQVGLLSQKSLLPTLLYVMCMGSASCTLTPLVFVNAVLVACIHQLLLRGTLLAIPVGKISAATALIGVCTMFYLPSLALLLAYLLVVVIYRLYGWRDWAALVLGFAAPYVLLCTVLYLHGSLPEWWQTVAGGLSGFDLGVSPAGAVPMAANLCLVLVALIALAREARQMGEKPVVWQKNATAVLLFTVGGLAMLPYEGLLPVDMQLFAVPFALCGGHLFALTSTGGTFTRQRAMQRRKEVVLNTLFFLTFVASLLC